MIMQLEDVQIHDLSKQPSQSLVFSAKDNREEVFDHQPYDNASSSVDVNKEADEHEYYDEEEDDPSYINEKQLYDEMI